MKHSKKILKEPAFVLCLERHKDIRFFPTKKRLNKAGFENVHPFEGLDGSHIGDNHDDTWGSGVVTLGEYLLDMPVKNGHYTGGGQFGVFASFLFLWRYLASSNLDGIFIFEDDALPRPDFKEIFPTYWDSVENDVDIVFLGGGSYGEEMRKSYISKFGSEKMISKNGLIWKGQLDCLHAYYLTKSGAKKLLSIYENLSQYNCNDPLLVDHLKTNMDWFDLCGQKLNNYTDSNQHPNVYKNLQTHNKDLIETLNLSCDERGLPIECESNKEKLDNCFKGNANLFNQNLYPRLQKEHYIADGFMSHILTPVDFHWDTLRDFMGKECKNLKSAAFIGDAIPLTTDYKEDEIPWGSLSNQPPRDCGIIHQNAHQQSSIHGLNLVDELSAFKKEKLPTLKASHIFLIGMERCGSSSILEFLGTTIPIKLDTKGKMASKMAFNFFCAHKILNDLEDDTSNLCAYGNLAASFISGEEKLSGTNQREIPLNMFRLFKELYNQYPESKFIYNTRNIDEWVDKRRKIGDGYIMDYYRRCSNPELSDTKEWKEKTIEEVNEDWRKSFTNHRKEVLDFFEEKDSDRFLEFNIADDHPQKIIDFLPELSLKIEDAWEIREKWGNHNQ